MSRDLVFRAPVLPDAVPEWVLVANGRRKRSGKEASPEFETPIDRVFVILPASDVFISKVMLATRSAREAAQAVPFLIEDELAAPVEDTRVAVGTPAGDGQRWVYAARADLVDRWAVLGCDYGVRKVHFVPDGFAALGESEDATIFGDKGDLVICRPGSDRPIQRIESGLLAETLPVALSYDKPGTLAVADNVDWTEIVGVTLPQPRRFAAYDLPTKIASLPDDVLDRLPSFAPSAESGAAWLIFLTAFRRAAAIIAIALVLMGVTFMGEGAYYHIQRNVIDEAGTELFARTFPELRIVNPEAQLRQQIAAAGGTGGSDFLALATAVGEITRQVEGVEVQALRYDRALNVLNVSAHYRDFSDFEALNQASVELGVVLEDGGVRQAGGNLSGEFAVRLP